MPLVAPLPPLLVLLLLLLWLILLTLDLLLLLPMLWRFWERIEAASLLRLVLPRTRLIRVLFLSFDNSPVVLLCLFLKGISFLVGLFLAAAKSRRDWDGDADGDVDGDSDNGVEEGL